MNSSPTAADKLRQIEGWCQRLNPEEQLTPTQTQWLLRETATAAATVGAAETWLAIAQHDAARAKKHHRPRDGGVISPTEAEVAIRATAAQRLTTVSDTSFEEKCTLLQMPQGESQAGQGSAQAAPVAPPMPTTVTEVQQPNWRVVPKAPHPKLPPADWSQQESAELHRREAGMAAHSRRLPTWQWCGGRWFHSGWVEWQTRSGWVEQRLVYSSEDG